MHEKPTSFDIAFLAGVSQPTVSRALRGSPVVSLETRKRIEEIARQLNYRVDKNASNLRSQHSNTLALLLFEDPTPDDSQINPFFLSMLGSITRASARQGYDLLISFQQLSKDWQQDYEDSRKADGIILLGYGDYEEYRPRLERLVEQGTHFVRWGPVLDGQPGVSVGCDNCQGGYDVTRHLLASGRRRIAFLGHAVHSLPGILRPLPRLRARAHGDARAHLLGPAGRRHHHRGIRLPGRLRVARARRGVRRHRRGQRPHRHRRAARPAGSRRRRAAPGGGRRLRRHPRRQPHQSAVDHRHAGHAPRRRAAGGDAAAPDRRRTATNRVIPTRLVVRKSG